jgi:hypothetical protein
VRRRHHIRRCRWGRKHTGVKGAETEVHKVKKVGKEGLQSSGKHRVGAQSGSAERERRAGAQSRSTKQKWEVSEHIGER